MNEEDYEVDENRKSVSFRQRISMKNEEVGGSAQCVTRWYIPIPPLCRSDWNSVQLNAFGYLW